MNLDTIQIALGEYGLKELPGIGDNPVIMQMAKDAGFTDYVHDAIAWCSLFANWVAFKAGYERSNSLAARSWLNVGTETTSPELGDIVVLWRDNPTGPFGHVGFFINAEPNGVWLLAGNQSDMVNASFFPKNRILGYRQLNKIT